VIQRSALDAFSLNSAFAIVIRISGFPIPGHAISSGVPITNTTSNPSPAAGIEVTEGTGAFSTDVDANAGISAVNNGAGMIVVGLGTPTASFTVTPTTESLFLPPR